MKSIQEDGNLLINKYHKILFFIDDMFRLCRNVCCALIEEAVTLTEDTQRNQTFCLLSTQQSSSLSLRCALN